MLPDSGTADAKAFRQLGAGVAPAIGKQADQCLVPDINSHGDK
jgi:hypothetical protein